MGRYTDSDFPFNTELEEAQPLLVGLEPVAKDDAATFIWYPLYRRRSAAEAATRGLPVFLLKGSRRRARVRKVVRFE